MKITPIGERVLLKKTKQADRTKGGIYIPESAKEDKKEGEVVAAGTTKDGKEIPLKKGDKIIYGGYSAEEIKVDGEEYIVIEFKDVVAKLE